MHHGTLTLRMKCTRTDVRIYIKCGLGINEDATTVSFKQLRRQWLINID